MKNINLQQGKKPTKDKDPFASDEEQAYDDSIGSSDGNNSDSQVIDTRI